MATGKEIRARLKEEARKRARLRSMEERQAKKTAVSGTMKGKQVDTTMGPNMSGIKKSERGQALFKNVKVPYKPTPKIEGNIASRVDNSEFILKMAALFVVKLKEGWCNYGCTYG
jgi:hypothetical protein